MQQLYLFQIVERLILFIIVMFFQKLDINGTTFYFYAENYEEKEGWIGALGRAMIKPSIMIDSAFDNEYM